MYNQIICIIILICWNLRIRLDQKDRALMFIPKGGTIELFKFLYGGGGANLCNSMWDYF